MKAATILVPLALSLTVPPVGAAGAAGVTPVDRSPWQVGGQARVRFDSKIGAGVIPTRDFTHVAGNENEFASASLRLRLGYAPAAGPSVLLEGREARTFSDVRPVRERDRFDVYQLHARVPFGPESRWSALLGRQEFVYGDQRYLGSADWSIVGRSFDAVRVRYRDAQWQIDAFAARPVVIDPHKANRSNDYDTLTGVHATRRTGDDLETEWYALARNVRPGSPNALGPGLGGPGPRDVYFLGQRWRLAPRAGRAWDGTLELTGQAGSVNQGGTRLDLRAWTAFLTVGRTWHAVPGQPRLAVGCDYGTGDGDPGDRVVRTAEMLHGTNHKAYGNMDLTGPRNLRIPRMEVSVRPTRTVVVTMEWLGSWLNESEDYFYPESAGPRTGFGYGRNPQFGSRIGQEIELLVDWRRNAREEVRFGFGNFLPGSYVRRSVESSPASGGVREARWAYVQFAVTF